MLCLCRVPNSNFSRVICTLNTFKMHIDIKYNDLLTLCRIQRVHMQPPKLGLNAECRHRIFPDSSNKTVKLNVPNTVTKLTAISLITTLLPLQYRMFFPFGSPLITSGIPRCVRGRVAKMLSGTVYKKSKYAHSPTQCLTFRTRHLHSKIPPNMGKVLKLEKYSKM